MVPVSLEQQSALSGRAGREQSDDRQVVATEHPMLDVDGEPAFRMHIDCAERAETDIRSLAQRLVIADG